MGFLKGFLILAALLYVAAGVILFFKQEQFLFPAETERVAPTFDWIEAYDLPTPDGEKIVTWYAPPTGPSCPTLVFFHGNGSRIDFASGRYLRAREAGLGTLAISYRGYSGSTGAPSEKGLHIDSETAWKWLTEEKGVSPDQIILHGHSLGTGVAVQLAARHTPRALILESPFASMQSTAQHHVKFFPVSWIIKHPFRSDKFIGKVKAPILMAHGTMDRVVPYSQSQKLIKLAPEPKTFVSFEGGNHNSLPAMGLYEKTIWPFLAGIIPNCTSLSNKGTLSHD